MRSALDAAIAAAAAERLRLRLVLSPEGAHEPGLEPIAPTPPETLWRVAVAKRRFVSAEPMLRHKTTRRELYEEELARSGADEVLFLNERDESLRRRGTNVFLAQGEILLTPPIASGLLPGTLRASLLAEGRAREEYVSSRISRAGSFHGQFGARARQSDAALREASPPFISCASPVWRAWRAAPRAPRCRRRRAGLA